jgi:hypothetical protein
MPLTIFLDTSALPRNPTALPAEFRALVEMADEGIVSVHLSTIAQKEWISQRQKEFTDKTKAAQTAVNNLIRDKWSPSLEIHGQLTEIVRWLSEHANQVADQASEEAAAVLNQLRPAIVPIGDTHAESVFQNYFEGGLPFASTKSRKDLPDAFILEALQGIAVPADELVHAVIHDGRLRDAADKLPQVRTYESLKALFIFPEIVAAQNTLQRATAWRSWWEHNQADLSTLQDELESEIQRVVVDALAYKAVEHPQIPDDNHEGMIAGINEAENIEIDWDNTEPFGVGILSVPVEFEVEVMIDFSVFRMDAFSVPAGVSVSLGDFENDHYFEAQADIRVHVLSNAVFRIPESEIEDQSIATIEDFSLDDDVEIEVIEDDVYGIFTTVPDDSEP